MPIITISGNTGSGAIGDRPPGGRQARFRLRRQANPDRSRARPRRQRARTSPAATTARRRPACARDSPPSSRTSSSAQPSPAPPTPSWRPAASRPSWRPPIARRRRCPRAAARSSPTTATKRRSRPIMTGLAEKGDVVIIGRGSQAILCDRPDTLHIAVTAPFAVRVQRIAERDSMSPRESEGATSRKAIRGAWTTIASTSR